MSTETAQPLDPISLRRAFLITTRQIFGHPDNYGVLAPLLGKYVYDADETVSKLPVRLDYEFDPEKLGGSGTPTVWVGMGDLDLEQLVVNNAARSLEANAGYKNVQRAGAVMAIKCVSGNADEALGLATIAANYYAGLRQLLMDRLGLQNFQVRRIGRPQLVDKAPDRMISSDCTIAITFNFTLNATVEGHRLKTIQITTVPLTGA